MILYEPPQKLNFIFTRYLFLQMKIIFSMSIKLLSLTLWIIHLSNIYNILISFCIIHVFLIKESIAKKYIRIFYFSNSSLHLYSNCIIKIWS